MTQLRSATQRFAEGPISNLVLTVLLVNLLLVLARGSYALLGLPISSPSLFASVLLLLAWGMVRLMWASRERLRRDVWFCWLRDHDAEVALGALLFVGLAIRPWGIDFGAPLVIHPDEDQVAGRTILMLRRGWIDPPEPFVYPTVFQYLLLPAFGLYYVRGLSAGVWDSLTEVHREEFGFYYVARAHSAVLGTLTILLVYLVARRLWPGSRGRWVGTVAATFMTFSFNHVRQSHFAVTDAAMTFFVVLALLAVVGVYREGSLWQYVVAGFLVGIACATKYNALPIVFVLVAAHFLGRPLRGWASWSGVAGLGAAPFGFFTGYPYALLNWRPFLDHLGKLGRYTGDATFDPADRFQYLVGYSMESGLGWLFTIVLAAAFLYALHRRRGEDLLSVVLIVGTLVMLTHSSHRFFPRYLLPLIPAAALLVASFLVEGAERVRRQTRMTGAPRWLDLVPCGVGLLVVVLVWPQAAESFTLARALALPDTRAQAAVYLARRFVPGATVASEAQYFRLHSDYRVLDWRPLESERPVDFVREDVDAVVFSGANDRTDVARRREQLRARLIPLREFASADGVASGPTVTVYLHQRPP